MAEAALSKKTTVTVYCRHPSGMILELDHMRMEAPTPGATLVPVHYPTGQKVEIHGYLAGHPDAGPNGFANHPNSGGRVSFGYGLTEVDADFWREWIKQKKDFPLVRNGTVGAEPEPERAVAAVKEKSTIKTGLEPINPDKPGPGIKKDDGKSS